MKNLFLLLFAVAALSIFSCVSEDDPITDSNVMLTFSVDTLRFDTVFTEQGSATRFVRVFNNFDQPVIVSQIALDRGTQSKFRMNVDGLPGAIATEVEIPANDSIYIFAEVTIDPDQDLSASPYVVEDAITFLTNGNSQRVVLEAWGQNANYVPNRFANGQIAVLQCNGQDVIWDDPKPYVIFGILVIDECNLVLPAGTQVYVHGGLEFTLDSMNVRQYFNDGRIITTGSGSIRIEGTRDNPVTIQGDRLEEGFQEESGQWFGIVLSAGSTGNQFNYVNIKNSALGVAVDSAGSLAISNSTIYNTSSHGLFGIHSRITADNCLIYNNGATAVRLTYGGDYDFRHTTVASYGVDATALSVSNLLCLDQLCQSVLVNPVRAHFTNCIIAGSRDDEITLVEFEDIEFDYNFDHCIVKVEDLLMQDQYPMFLEDCNSCINVTRNDALFFDANEDDYHLDTLSVAEGKAFFLSELPLDLDGIERDTENPDVGCYEYVYE